MGSALMSSTKVYRSPESLTFTPFPFCSERNWAQGQGLLQFLSIPREHFFFFLEPCQESTYSLLKNCNAAHVWWCDDGCRCVSKVKKHCWIYTWWIIAINVKYASAAKTASVSFSFIIVCWIVSHRTAFDVPLPPAVVLWIQLNDAVLLYHKATRLVCLISRRPLSAMWV